ncbi:MAG TPA: NAD(P)-dependent oxidoreductase [Kofleriaceae bacterium]
MRVLIIGNRSFIALRLRERLGKEHEVLLAGRTGDADVQFDLTATGAPPREVPRCDAIIHCAASFEPNTPDGILRNELVNGVGALRVAELATRIACGRIVHLSTVSVFNDDHGRLRDSYALSKRHGQDNLQLVCDAAGIELCTLCPTAIYDERGAGRHHQPLLYRIVDCARRGEDFPLYGSADPARNYLHVRDLAELVAGVMRAGVSGTFPVVFPRDYRITEIAELAFAVFGTTGRIVRRPDMPDIPVVRYPRSRELFDRLGWVPALDLEAGFRLLRDHHG